MEQLTENELLVLSVLKLVDDNIAATKQVIGFIDGSSLKYQLFTKCYEKNGGISDVVQRTDSSIADATQMLTLFDAIISP